MQRLLQGDVGSGKTIVAALAALRAVGRRLAGGGDGADRDPRRAALPQVRRWLDAARRADRLAHGSLQRQERRARRGEAIAAGATAIAVGTHALFQEGVEFARLGLAIVDEQHRFGVQQRLALRAQGRARRRGALSRTS